MRVTSRDGRTLTQVAAARAARELRLHFGDGAIDAASTARPSPRVERAPRRSYIAPQPSLFDEAEE